METSCGSEHNALVYAYFTLLNCTQHNQTKGTAHNETAKIAWKMRALCTLLRTTTEIELHKIMQVIASLP